MWKGRNCSSTLSLFCVASQPYQSVFKVECVWYFCVRTLVGGYVESVHFSENTANATVGSCRYIAPVMALIFLCSTFVQLNLNSSLEILHQFIMTKIPCLFSSPHKFIASSYLHYVEDVCAVKLADRVAEMPDVQVRSIISLIYLIYVAVIRGMGLSDNQS